MKCIGNFSIKYFPLGEGRMQHTCIFKFLMLELDRSNKKIDRNTGKC